jgi:hypothetical protein
VTLREWWTAYLARDGTDRELLAILGLIMLGFGLALAWLPLAFIVPGALLVLIALGFTLHRGGS